MSLAYTAVRLRMEWKMIRYSQFYRQTTVYPRLYIYDSLVFSCPVTYVQEDKEINSCSLNFNIDKQNFACKNEKYTRYYVACKNTTPWSHCHLWKQSTDLRIQFYYFNPGVQGTLKFPALFKGERYVQKETARWMLWGKTNVSCVTWCGKGGMWPRWVRCLATAVCYRKSSRILRQRQTSRQHTSRPTPQLSCLNNRWPLSSQRRGNSSRMNK